MIALARRLRIPLALLLLAACREKEEAAVAPLPSLAVVVVDAATGRPIEDVLVYLQDSSGVRAQERTDREGRCDFGILVEGPYVVHAGRRLLGVVRAARRIELTEPTEVRLELRRYEGFKVKVVVPEDEATPKLVRVAYRKKDSDKRPMITIPLDDDGAGHTMSIYPDSYEMTFEVIGYAPVTLDVEVPHRGVEPVFVRLGPR